MEELPFRYSGSLFLRSAQVFAQLVNPRLIILAGQHVRSRVSFWTWIKTTLGDASLASVTRYFLLAAKS